MYSKLNHGYYQNDEYLWIKSTISTVHYQRSKNSPLPKLDWILVFPRTFEILLIFDILAPHNDP